MYIVLLGPPGSGKGTQGELLAEHFHISHVSTGDLLRAILSNPDHPLYPEVQVIKEGKLVSDEVVNKVIEDGLNKHEHQNGIIFDGYPRTVSQARSLDNMLFAKGRKVDMVIDLDVTEEVLLERLLGRRMCPDCKKIYHIKQGYEKCPECDVALIKRDDDNEETITERFKEYRSKTAPVQQYYTDSSANYINVVVKDSSLTPQDVQKEILSKLNGLR